MILEKVKIENFRMLRDFELDFKEDLSLIVGKNNSGKTSLLTIMDRFLNSKNTQFKWDDFHSDYQKSFYNILMNQEEANNVGGIKQTLFIKYDHSDNYANIQKLMLDLNPNNNIVILEFYYSISQEKFKKLKEDLERNKKTKWEDFMRYMKKNSSRYFFMNTYARRFDAENQQLTNEVSAPLDKKDVERIIKLKSIKADREASNKHNDSSLSSLSSKYYEYLKFNDDDIVENLEETILETDKSLNKVYKDVFNKITKSVEKFGAADGKTQLNVQSTLIDKELLSGNTTLYYSQDGIHLPESYNGLGHLNLIGMIFEIETIITAFHGKEEEPKADINIIFIEEPEAHTHPQLQYVFIKNIKDLIRNGANETNFDLNIQTIMTTHSSHIVSECDFDDIRYLKKENNYAIAKSFEELKHRYYNNNSEQVFKFVKQYLTLNRSELFFADKVIFIEGDTERLLLPSMLKKRDSKLTKRELRLKNMAPLLSQNITIIEAGTYAHYFSKLITFLGIKALVITDIDAAKSSNENHRSCAPEEAESTSNPSLKSFLSTDNFSIISELDQKQKIFRYSRNKTNETYNLNLNGNFRIAYQIKENNNQANSFEDAFIHLNSDFIKDNIDIFEQGLKNKNDFDHDQLSAFQLAENCINKKTAFAMEILLASEENFENWKTPEYIEEGLVWLQQQ